MKHPNITAVPVLALTLLIAACNSQTDKPSAAPETEASNTISASSSPEPAAVASDAGQFRDKVLTLEGLGELKLSQPIPATSGWAVRGAQVSDACQTASSPRFPGAYAIVTGGKVRRITVGEGSGVKLIEGIGVGATESDVKKWFAGFRDEPHKYIAAPARYLTAPNAASGGPALRFEIDANRKVGLIHVGTMPELGLVEGCS